MASISAFQNSLTFFFYVFLCFQVQIQFTNASIDINSNLKSKTFSLSVATPYLLIFSYEINDTQNGIKIVLWKKKKKKKKNETVLKKKFPQLSLNLTKITRLFPWFLRFSWNSLAFSWLLTSAAEFPGDSRLTGHPEWMYVSAFGNHQ